jgi:hypothetical protein
MQPVGRTCHEKNKTKIFYDVYDEIVTWQYKDISKILPSRKIVLIRHEWGNLANSLVTSRESSNLIGHFLFLWRINTILRLGEIFDIR